jgi:hypothetical protein
VFEAVQGEDNDLDGWKKGKRRTVETVEGEKKGSTCSSSSFGDNKRGIRKRPLVFPCKEVGLRGDKSVGDVDHFFVFGEASNGL